MPQLTQRSGSTRATTSARPSLRGSMVIASYGQSSEHCRQPVQIASSTTDGGRAPAAGRAQRGTRSRSAAPPSPASQTAPGASPLVTASHPPKSQSTVIRGGSANAVPSGSSDSGAATDATTSSTTSDQVSRVGGSSTGRASRETWSQSAMPIASGMARWTNRVRKKNVPGTGRSPMNARLTGSDRIGSASTMRALSTASARPKPSHTRTNPVTPQSRSSPSRTSPDTQASARGPQVRRCTTMRPACTKAAAMAASEA